MTTLITWLWQGTALSLAALVVLRASRRLDAATRHALWWGVLAVVLALPWLPSLVASAGSAVPAAAAAPVPAPDAVVLLPAPPDWLLAIALGAWLGTVVVGGLRVARGLRFVVRVKREGRALDPDRQRRLLLWSSTTCPRAVTLLVSPLVRTACAVGLGRAAIVLPPALIDSVDDDALDQIVMHERAHLERYDDLWRLAETLVDGIAGLHPGVRIALAQIDLEREAACDDRVVLRTGAADRYAACLAAAAAAAASARRSHAHLLPTAVAGRSALVARVTRLLDATRHRRARLTPAATLAGLVLLGAVAGASAHLDPLVAFRASDVRDTLAPAVTPAPLAAESFRLEVPAAAAPIEPRAAASRRMAPAVFSRTAEAAAVQSSAAVTSTPGEKPAGSLLASRTLTITTDAAPAAVGTRPPRAQAESSSHWSAAADGGAAVGSAARSGGAAVGTGARKAATSVAGFFVRAGRTVGKSF